MAEQVFRTAMRTTDIIITALFSPAAVVAIGLADLYARFPLRIGLGLGGGAIALSSQDTGAGEFDRRNEAVTQAIIIGAVTGVPFVLFGLVLGELAIGIFGASQEVIRLGSVYLAIIFATAPARHVGIVAGRALQGTGDTMTPMYINVFANGLNIVASAVLGLGLLGFPRMEIIGVGVATAAANVLTAVLLLYALWGTWTDATFARPRDLTLTKQLIQVSTPRMAEGLTIEIAEFPFNALLLGFGEVVNAGFQIGRRVYQQVTGPLSRGYGVAAAILVGQALGRGDLSDSRYNGWAVASLGVVTVGTIGLVLVVAARPLVALFTSDPATTDYAVAFSRVYGFTAIALVSSKSLAGALEGASETRIPFVARFTGMFGFFLGASWLLSRPLGFGPFGSYVGIFLAYVWIMLFVIWGFERTGWAARAESMMEKRGSVRESEDVSTGTGADPVEIDE